MVAGLDRRESMEDPAGMSKPAATVGISLPPGQNRLGSLHEDLVKQGEHGNGQQADERPNHLVQGVHLRPKPGELSLRLRPELGDLSSDGGDDVLPTQMTYLLDGRMDQLGIRTAVKQDAMDCGGVRFR